ncbi:unnamed protein product [Oncorhynchus mykiss]|uniref:Myosin IXb n=1 Tax=Oncorhynchus mykiss TaxID=8022 RepID=A0A060WXT7_ONCMY|nr:unnamed protein product [Oncorhynchus mykiss]
MRKYISSILNSGCNTGKFEGYEYFLKALYLYTSSVFVTVNNISFRSAFGNAKTAQNNNSSRFGKFIRVNYLKSGVVRGAVVEKYLLEKCRLVFRAKNERNYHVFYYLLVGASKEEQREFSLLQPEDYTYLQQEYFHLEDAEDLRHEFERLHQAMEMVGFLPSTKKQIFSMLSAILYLGNVTYTQSEDGQALEAGPADVLSTLSDLLKVKQELLVEALTKRKQTTANDKLVLHYTLKEAVTARDSMAKSLYSSLFDWIVLHINHALLNRRDMEEAVSCLSIGILDIFGFEDFQTNSFEQFCINYANEKLQYYFNQHIFKLEQKEYQAEGISWSTIDYTDNLGCIHLISQKPTGLFHLLDEESNLPQATDDTLLNKFKQQHQDNPYFVPTTVMLPAFVIQHFAGKVKYQIKDFRKKNTDHMRPDIVALLRSSERAFMRQLIGSDPVAVFRWGILRATIRIIAAFNEAGSRRAVPGLVKRTSRQSIGELKRRPSSALQRLSSHSSLLDFSFDRSDDNPLEVFEDIFANYEKKNHEYIIIVIHLACKIQEEQGQQAQAAHSYVVAIIKEVISWVFLLVYVTSNLMNSRSLKHIVGLTLHDRASRSLLHPHQRKKPPSISAQFQASLNKLLETVGKAEPFFIRCIRSNAEKKEMLFDNALVQQQLRYTGMLETVRIQKSGYNAKFTFTEFLEQFKVLLPKEATTAPEDIANLLQKMGLGQSTYQIGKTKVFLKEREKQHLQDTLNKEVMRHIVILQRWFRACLSRSHFLYKKDAAIRIQRCWRAFRADTRCRAATVIQAAWRGSQKRKDYLRKRNSIKKMQTLFRNKPDLNSSKAEVEKPMPPQLPSKTQSMPQPLPKLQPKHQNQPSPKHQTQHQRSLERKELRRQHSLEPSPNRSLQPGPEVNRQEATQRNTESEKREGRGSPPPLNRPLSLPHDPKVGRYDSLPSLTSLPLTPSFTSDLSTVIADVNQHFFKQIKIYFIFEVLQSSHLFVLVKSLHTLGILSTSFTWNALPTHPHNVMLTPPCFTVGMVFFGLQASPFYLQTNLTMVRVRSRKRPNHKRRLAYARSGLMFNLKGSQESEFWSFPLPPMSPSPGVSGMGQSNQPDVHIRPRKPEVQVPTGLTMENYYGPWHCTLTDSCCACTPLVSQSLAGWVCNVLQCSAAILCHLNTVAGWLSGCCSLFLTFFVIMFRQHHQNHVQFTSQKGERLNSAMGVVAASRQAFLLGNWIILKNALTLDIHSISITSKIFFYNGGKMAAQKWLHSGFKTSLPTMFSIFQESSDITTDIGRFSLPARSTNESSIIKDYSQSQPTTPERLGFFSKIMKKLPNRDSQPPEYGKRTNENTQSEKGAISPYPLSSEGSGQPHNPSIRISRAARVSEKWNASLEREITNINELRNLDEFLGNQVNELRTRAKKLSATESIFLTATMQFRETIKGMYSISKPHISYKGLMKGYQNRVSSLAEAKQQTEVQSVVNLFQSVLDGFIRGEIKRAEAGPVKVVLNRMRGKKSKCPNSPLDHMFSTYQVNIMQSCDLCGSFIWGMEKAYMCSACKLICHKKCLSKIINACSTRCARLDDGVPGHLHFGVQVCVLTSKTYPIPMVVQMMLEHVEMNGLYTEGIYRKSGSACHARELHQLLETNPERATLEKYSIHTVTGLVKRWLRELPEPLLTFSLYNDFLHAVELPEQSEQLRAVYQKLDDLPPSNFNTLERLVFHLVRVAKEEEHNRMSANCLAIVFAPCILRSPDTTDPFLSMKDISKTTTCVEILILEQFRRYNEKMQEITELEFAEALAVNKLMLKRQNTILEKSSSELDVPQMDDLNRSDIDMESERTLIERIKSIKEEKEELACRLPELEQENFDDSESRLSLSISSESLLEDRVRRSVERQECPPKPADLAQRTTATDPRDQPDGQNPQPNTKARSRNLSDLDIPFIDEEDYICVSLSSSISPRLKAACTKKTDLYRLQGNFGDLI